MIKEITGTIYQSSDGKCFVNRDECLKYEKKLGAINSIKYYMVKHDLICAESGNYNNCTYFAIAEPTIKGAYYKGLDALEDYCMRNYSSNGNGLFYTDTYHKCTIRRYTRPITIMKDEFFSANREIYERIYFSDEPIIQLDDAGVKRLGYESFRR